MLKLFYFCLVALVLTEDLPDPCNNPLHTYLKPYYQKQSNGYNYEHGYEEEKYFAGFKGVYYFNDAVVTPLRAGQKSQTGYLMIGPYHGWLRSSIGGGKCATLLNDSEYKNDTIYIVPCDNSKVYPRWLQTGFFTFNGEPYRAYVDGYVLANTGIVKAAKCAHIYMNNII